MWNIVGRVLLLPAQRDRAVATTTSALFELKARLKDLHSGVYRSQDINWHIWANFIQSSEAHLRQSLETQPPPSHLIHLFAHHLSDYAVQAQNIRRSLHVASNINDNFSTVFGLMKSTLQSLKRKHEETQYLLDAWQSQLSSLTQTNSSHDPDEFIFN
jgi:hypothetical protein